MAKDDTKPGMAKAERHVYGPRAVGSMVPGLTRPAFRKASPAGAQIMVDWESIVGPALSAVTTPRRLSAGTLTIACSGPIAMELQHMAIELIHRINAHVGSQNVRALRFMQVAPAAKPIAPPPPHQAVAAAEAAVAHLPAGELRDALAALGRRLLAPRRPSTQRSPNR